MKKSTIIWIAVAVSVLALIIVNSEKTDGAKTPLVCHVGGTMTPVMKVLGDLYLEESGQPVVINSAVQRNAKIRQAPTPKKRQHSRLPFFILNLTSLHSHIPFTKKGSRAPLFQKIHNHDSTMLICILTIYAKPGLFAFL